jgi:hypothetical protein
MRKYLMRQRVTHRSFPSQDVSARAVESHSLAPIGSVHPITSSQLRLAVTRHVSADAEVRGVWHRQGSLTWLISSTRENGVRAISERDIRYVTVARDRSCDGISKVLLRRTTREDRGATLTPPD